MLESSGGICCYECLGHAKYSCNKVAIQPSWLRNLTITVLLNTHRLKHSAEKGFIPEMTPVDMGWLKQLTVLVDSTDYEKSSIS